MLFLLYILISLANGYAKDNDDPFLLFCICPYPIKDDINRRNRYFVSFTSWLLTSPKTKILIMMSPLEFDPNDLLISPLEKIFGQGCIIFTSKTIEGDEENVPFIDEWFINGLDYALEAGASLVCWINADIITPKGWFPRIKFLYDHFSHRNNEHQKSFMFWKQDKEQIQFSAISRRCDFNVADEELLHFFNHFSIGKNSSNFNDIWSNDLNYDPDEDNFPNFNETFSRKWPPNYDAFATKRNRHSQWGIDFFLFSLHYENKEKLRQEMVDAFQKVMLLNIDEIPQFHMGRYRWDPWITGWIFEKTPLVTLGDAFCTYHINHKPTNRHPNSPKVKENLELGARNQRFLASNKNVMFRFGKIEKDEIEKENNSMNEDENALKKRTRRFEEFSRFFYGPKNSLRGKLPENVPKANAPPGDE